MSNVDVTTTARLDKSALFHFYNKARVSGLDRKRVNRALGYVQAGRVTMLANGSALVAGNGDTYLVDPYHGCECPDALYRTPWCKHRIAWGIMTRMAQQAEERATAPTTIEEDIEALYGTAA